MFAINNVTLVTAFQRYAGQSLSQFEELTPGSRIAAWPKSHCRFYASTSLVPQRKLA
jgi:hypothetical protein